jgi:hypothetical protein
LSRLIGLIIWLGLSLRMSLIQQFSLLFQSDRRCDVTCSVFNLGVLIMVNSSYFLRKQLLSSFTLKLSRWRVR